MAKRLRVSLLHIYSLTFQHMWHQICAKWNFSIFLFLLLTLQGYLRSGRLPLFTKAELEETLGQSVIAYRIPPRIVKQFIYCDPSTFRLLSQYPQGYLFFWISLPLKIDRDPRYLNLSLIIPITSMVQCSLGNLAIFISLLQSPSAAPPDRSHPH